MCHEKLFGKFKAFIVTLLEENTPKIIYEDLEDECWRKAVNEELTTHEKNGTWRIIKLPARKRTVGSKWVFIIKRYIDGSAKIYKVRLVAKGFTQSYGLDYKETFASVAKLNIIMILLSLVANLDWKLHQMDVKNVFLNVILEEEVYMEVLVGLDRQTKPGEVCQLEKALYGLK